jgi:hypothetical protein
VSSELLLTGWTGAEFAQIAAHTNPRMARYADEHGMDFCTVNLCGPRPASWQKVPALMAALEKYERVVWIDADVVICNEPDSIFDEMPASAIQGMVPHVTPCGVVPNCGVWVLTREMMPTLAAAWECGRHITHYWWEQAAILELMGYGIAEDERGFPRCLPGKATPLRERTEWLSPKWNHHPMDEWKVRRPNFIHVTGYSDRLGVIKELCSVI